MVWHTGTKSDAHIAEMDQPAFAGIGPVAAAGESGNASNQTGTRPAGKSILDALACG
jgi:hypothetical protein